MAGTIQVSVELLDSAHYPFLDLISQSSVTFKHSKLSQPQQSHVTRSTATFFLAFRVREGVMKYLHHPSGNTCFKGGGYYKKVHEGGISGRVPLKHLNLEASAGKGFQAELVRLLRLRFLAGFVIASLTECTIQRRIPPLIRFRGRRIHCC